MSEHVPTTEEVREQFAECRGCYICDGNDAELVHGAEFDRWVAVMKAEAWQRGVDEIMTDMRAAYSIDILSYGPNPYLEGNES